VLRANPEIGGKMTEARTEGLWADVIYPSQSYNPDTAERDLLPYDLVTMKEDVMHCLACHRAMVSTSSQAIEDEKGAMTITQWRCRCCHETAEEIWRSAGYRGPDPVM